MIDNNLTYYNDITSNIDHIEHWLEKELVQ